MSLITDTPPSSIIEEIVLLNGNLDVLIPAK